MAPMHTSLLSGPQDVAPSRRQFLRWGTRAAAGLSLTPALLASGGCGEKAVVAPAADPATHVLRARRFRGAPDGREREIWGYDGLLPGPVIRAREGETLRVKVINELGVPTSVHWHGMHQRGTWQMDGVEGVSRPPIPAGSEFLYEFRAEPAGTHWYHAHVGVQYGEGLFGPLIVEERRPAATYDREEVLLINDWFLEPGEVLLDRLVKGAGMKAGMKPGHPAGGPDGPARRRRGGMKDVGDVPLQSVLFNGKGRAPGDTRSPLAALEVKKGETVRLRLINGSSTYAFRFRIDGHPLTVIAADGMPVRPVTVDDLLLGVGERYDVLLEADQDGAFWIRAASPDGGGGLAVLHYSGSQRSEPEPSPARWGPRSLAPEQLRSPAPVNLPEDGVREVPLVLGGSMTPYRWGINGQFYPKADPIVLKKDQLVRFVFRNPTGMDHPFHLHGHSFDVLGRPGALNRKDPPVKDTVNVPAKGELVIQWKADNPGRWFFHCHIEWHMATGMARVINIEG
jgi:FtsP/CotA-like multicopper oxidase with cupredoxin domain